MREMVEYIAKTLASEPDSVEVTEEDDLKVGNHTAKLTVKQFSNPQTDYKIEAVLDPTNIILEDNATNNAEDNNAALFSGGFFRSLYAGSGGNLFIRTIHFQGAAGDDAVTLSQTGDTLSG